MSNDTASSAGATAALGHQRQPRETGHRGRVPVWALAFAGFTLVTSVTYPVGVLPQIAADLDASTGSAGLTVTVSALVTGLAAGLLGVSTRVLDRRRALIAAVVLAGVGNLAAAIAPNLPVVLAARVGVGIGSGGFWGIAAGAAPLLVPPDRVARATAVIFGSAAAASAIGVPLTTALGTGAGWRAGTVALAATSAIGSLGLARFLPTMSPSAGRRHVRQGTSRTAFTATRWVLLVAVLVVVGHFAAFTFARPALEQISGVPTGAIPALLAGYGGAGMLGAALAGRHAVGRPRRAAQVIAATMAVAVAAICLMHDAPVLAAILLCIWGAGYGALGVTLPLWVHVGAGDDDRRASAIYIAIFNGAIALGAAVGGVVVDATGWRPAMVAPLILASCLIVLGIAAAQFAGRGRMS